MTMLNELKHILYRKVKSNLFRFHNENVIHYVINDNVFF